MVWIPRLVQLRDPSAEQNSLSLQDCLRDWSKSSHPPELPRARCHSSFPHHEVLVRLQKPVLSYLLRKQSHREAARPQESSQRRFSFSPVPERVRLVPFAAQSAVVLVPMPPPSRRAP